MPTPNEATPKHPTPTPPATRRQFLNTAATGVLGAGLATGCAADSPAGGPAVQTKPTVRWRVASSFPRSADTIYGVVEHTCERVAELTDGRFQIRPYPAGELVPGLQVMDAAQQGTVQISHTASYYFTGKNPALAFDTGVPFGMTARQQDAWLLQGGGLDLINRIYSDFGIVSFPAGNTGAQMGGWFRREVPSLESLRGLKMRIPGIGGEVMSELGVTVQVLAGGDIYPALERGAIDATEWVGPHDDERLGLHNAAQFYYYPGWWEPCSTHTYQVNIEAWNSLPSEYQIAFRTAVDSGSRLQMNMYDNLNPQALERLVAGGTQLRPFARDILVGAERMTEEYLNNQAQGDAMYQEVYDHWRAFRDRSFRWASTAEGTYAAYAFPSSRNG